MRDPSPLTADALLATIERRIQDISRRQHELAYERAVLQEQTVRLRMGVISPEAVLLHFQAYGVTLDSFRVKPRRWRADTGVNRVADYSHTYPVRPRASRIRGPAA